MIAWILFVTIFLAPTPTHPSVEVRASSIVVPSQDVCALAASAVMEQAHQDPKILDFAVHCIAVTGDIGKHA